MRTLAALLLSASLASANPLVFLSGKPPEVASGGLVDFEGTGIPASWTAGGTSPNWDYTTTPIEGAQSAFMVDLPSGTSEAIYDFPQDADEVWMAWKFQQSADLATSTDIVEFENSSGTTVASLNLNTTGLLKGKVDGTAGLTVADLTGSGFWKFKIRYVKGTGANEILEVWVTPEGAGTWGTSQIQSTGTSTTRADKLKFRNPAATNHDEKYDNVLTSTSDIPLGDID